jgi:hypothetical protein
VALEPFLDVEIEAGEPMVLWHRDCNRRLRPQRSRK